MKEKTFKTEKGTIHYWLDVPERVDAPKRNKPTLVMLPGLTADHRLFDKQIEHFHGRCSVFTWDAPGHAASWPFVLDFNLFDKAKWLEEILLSEGIARPVIIGQSMGGYVGQAYAQLYPDRLAGFVSIDSAPLQRKYITRAELWMLRRTETMYYYYPWKALLKSGSEGVATSEYGRALMRDMMMVYDGDKRRYSQLAGHGFRILADAMEKDLPYEINCPAMLICGKKDRAGSCIRYNKAWNKNTGIPIHWIDDAGHNSNTDKPEIINGLLEEFINSL